MIASTSGGMLFSSVLGIDRSGVGAMFLFSHPWTAVLMTVSGLACLSAGCNEGPSLAPVSGKVLVNEKPLTSGSVIYYPNSAKGNKFGGLSVGEINAQGPYNGYTAMHDSVWHGHREALQVILGWSGVRFDLRGLDGRTPEQLATDLGYADMAAMIRERSTAAASPYEPATNR